MDDLFADERIQFFLRNRNDIKTWAGIEPDVIAATRELLARSQLAIEERLLAIDPTVMVGRRDGGPYERIIGQHYGWPDRIGLSLEWQRSVDPFGGARPKIGVFWWAEPVSLVEPRTQFLSLVDKVHLQRLGFRVPLESVWPVGSLVASTHDWWRDPAAWVGSLVDQMGAVWPIVAPVIDRTLSGIG